MSAPQPAFDRPAAPPPTHEARWLVRLWRLSRLTLLLGGAGSGKSALLRDGVLPLMGRRQVDRALRHGTRVVVPFPERRGIGGERLPEVIVVFDDWQAGDPRTALRERLIAALPPGAAAAAVGDASLADCLALWHAQFGARFFIALDAFELLLRGQAGSETLRSLRDELVEALQHPTLPAHFLLALRDDAEALLEPLAACVPGLADHALRLPAEPAAAPQPPAPAGDDEFRAGLDTLLARIASISLAPAAAPVSSPGGWQPAAAAPLVTAAAPAVAPASPQPPADPPAPATAPPSRRRLALAASIGAVVLTLPLLAFIERTPEPPPAPAPRVATPATAPRPVHAAPEPPASVLRQLASRAGLELVGDLAALHDGRVALVGYDALQAARAAGGPGLRIVTPLYREEILFLVAADSPLRHLHQLDGRVLDAGPPGGRRAQTAQAVLQAMFARPASAAGSAAVLVTLGEPPLPGQRVLTLDRSQPASRRALGRFLPSAHGSLSVMSYLVAAEGSAGAPLAAFSRALCDALPALRRDGAPAWREVQFGRHLPAPWPEHPAAASALAACAPSSALPNLVTGERP